MEVWRTERVSGKLLDVPGIGPAAVAKLASDKNNDDGSLDDVITNTYQLFGKYLMLKGPDTDAHKVESVEHCEKFWQYLKSRGISSHRSAIVKAISEKAATFFVGIYDANMYEDADDDLDVEEE